MVFFLCDIVFNLVDLVNMLNLQYVGLVLEFNLFDLNFGWDVELFNDFKLWVVGNYVYNLGYDEGDMCKCVGGVVQIVNNFGFDGDIKSGVNVWMFQFILGNVLDMCDVGDWQVFVVYKYIQLDVLLDGFNDFIFYFGGINVKGYIFGVSYGFDKCVYGIVCWFSFDEVYGVLFFIDVL